MMDWKTLIIKMKKDKAVSIAVATLMSKGIVWVGSADNHWFSLREVKWALEDNGCDYKDIQRVMRWIKRHLISGEEIALPHVYGWDTLLFLKTLHNWYGSNFMNKPETGLIGREFAEAILIEAECEKRIQGVQFSGSMTLVRW